MKKKKGCLVTRNTVYEALTNPFYYGEMCVKGELLPHIYEPIINKSLFDKVQKRLNGDKDTDSISPYSSIPYIFRGIARCAKCGCRISQEAKTKKVAKVIIISNVLIAKDLVSKGELMKKLCLSN